MQSLAMLTEDSMDSPYPLEGLHRLEFVTYELTNLTAFIPLNTTEG